MANAEGDITPAMAVIFGQSAHRITVREDVHLELVFVATDVSPSAGYHIQWIASGVTASVSQQIIPQDAIRRPPFWFRGKLPWQLAKCKSM